jgi:hypothetical protein
VRVSLTIAVVSVVPFVTVFRRFGFSAPENPREPKATATARKLNDGNE